MIFNIYKLYILALKQDLRFHHEDYIMYFCQACMILNNSALKVGNKGEGFLIFDEKFDDEVVTKKKVLKKLFEMH